ncbi:MAG: Xaa-Pro peptidase family protein [Planctomycetota bacterium]|nr:Xaa-Pro peptidase family protein [Planctomycetota bacterium]
MATSALRRAVADRCKRLRAALGDCRADAILVTNPVEVAYLSGFTGEDSWLVVGSGKGWLITDGRFMEESKRDCPDFAVTVRRGSLVETLAKVLRRKRVGRLGYDPSHVSVALLSRLRRGLKGVSLNRVADAVSDLRIRKDRLEVRAIRRAVRAAEDGWKAFRKHIRLGMTEQALAGELEHQMRRAGADGLAFPTIVATDAHAARPHAKPGRRKLNAGSILLTDFGARVDGYVSDLTRVLFADRIAPRALAVYEVVREAQAAGIAAVGPGARLTDVDAAARTVIEEAGYGEQFGHGLGHGIGLEVHESPRLAPRGVKGRLEPGMVVTVEPGIYLRGRFGIRLEDDVLVTSTGRTVLSRLPKAPDDVVL